MAAGKTIAAAQDGWLVCEDEAGQGLRPPIAWTWARRGHTPTVRVPTSGHGRVNIAGLVCDRPGHRSRMIYRIRVCHGRRGEPKAFTWRDYRDLLQAAHQELGGPIVLCWDNLSVHGVPPLRAFLAAHTDWLTVVRFPPHSPDLNPVEGLWAMTKAHLANLAARNIDHLARIVKRRLKMIQYQPQLIDGCLAQTGLTLQPP